MDTELKITGDGSHTLFVPELDEHYHSVNGAIQESVHVYINAGFMECPKQVINVLEIGFGTGLNAFLTMEEGEKIGKIIRYTAYEKYPLPYTDAERLNYGERLKVESNQNFMKLHGVRWNSREEITPSFSLLKLNRDLSRIENLMTNERYDVVYFDAFAPDKQPDLWNQALFDKIFSICDNNAILTTYCAKGSVRRALQSAGFAVERLPGPAGKREMLRGRKPTTAALLHRDAKS